MADEIRLVTYANQQVTPQNDAVLTNLETPNNGIIFGCEISIKNASTLHINSGMGVIYGREFEIVDSDISVPLPGAGTELGQLYIHIDLSNTSAPVQLLIETGASLTPLVDDANLNVTTGITEYQLATFNVSTATIGDLVVTFENTKDIRTELGTADISGIGDGSVKGAISRINSDLSTKATINNATTTSTTETWSASTIFTNISAVQNNVNNKHKPSQLVETTQVFSGTEIGLSSSYANYDFICVIFGWLISGAFIVSNSMIIPRLSINGLSNQFCMYCGSTKDSADMSYVQFGFTAPQRLTCSSVLDTSDPNVDPHNNAMCVFGI